MACSPVPKVGGAAAPSAPLFQRPWWHSKMAELRVNTCTARCFANFKNLESLWGRKWSTSIQQLNFDFSSRTELDYYPQPQWHKAHNRIGEWTECWKFRVKFEKKTKFAKKSLEILHENFVILNQVLSTVTAALQFLFVTQTHAAALQVARVICLSVLQSLVCYGVRLCEAVVTLYIINFTYLSVTL